jgi:hypothetical protein
LRTGCPNRRKRFAEQIAINHKQTGRITQQGLHQLFFIAKRDRFNTEKIEDEPPFHTIGLGLVKLYHPIS